MEPSSALAVASGIASIGGSLIGASSGKKEAARNRDFQERMRNTSHQAEVEDLKKAGLNPILSATGGSGAAVPAGNVAPGIDTDIGTKAVSSALGALQQQNLEAERNKIKADTVNTYADAANKVSSAKIIEANYEKMLQEYQQSSDRFDFEKKTRTGRYYKDVGGKMTGMAYELSKTVEEGLEKLKGTFTNTGSAKAIKTKEAVQSRRPSHMRK